MSLFDAIGSAPLDPVLASIEAFARDSRPAKINLGVGMYYDEQGRIPLLKAVRAAEQQLEAGTSQPWSYIPAEGTAAFRRGVASLILGQQLASLEPRIMTGQALGGSGAISMGAHLLKQLAPGATVAISDPGWPNHAFLFEDAGFTVVTYPYYDDARGTVATSAVFAAIERLPPRSIVVLQACCHNPTGADFSAAEWEQLADLLQAKGHIPFVDLAYGGFGDGIEEDAAPVRMLLARGMPVFTAVSFSKSFALYGERVGALLVATDSPAQADLLLGQFKNVARDRYTTPPTHGAAVVATVLGSAELQQMWREELDRMRLRIRAMRQGLVDRLHGPNEPRMDLSRMLMQRGLFSYSGLTPEQVARLQAEFAIYALPSGRLCMAALNAQNLPLVADAISVVTA